MAQAPRDQNRVAALLGVSSIDGITPTPVAANPVNNALFVEGVHGLNLGVYDYVSMALSGGDTTETYTFKTGGSSGTTVATVVIVYTDDTREVLSSVTKT